jgi:hypothetical protein
MIFLGAESETDSVFLQSGSTRLKDQGASGKRTRNPSGASALDAANPSPTKTASEEAWERSQARAKSILNTHTRKYSSVPEVPEDVDAISGEDGGPAGTPKVKIGPVRHGVSKGVVRRLPLKRPSVHPHVRMSVHRESLGV